MIQIKLDAEMLARLQGLKEEVHFSDESGRLLGVFYPMSLKDMSPISDEELAERCKQKDGRPLSDILRDLEQAG